MGSYKPRDEAPGLQIRVIDLPSDEADWETTVARLHRLTLLGLGDDLAGVRVDLSSTADTNGADIECRLTVRLRRPRRALNVEARHPDGALALMQAFTRAQREAQRHLDGARREARRQVLGGED